MSEVKLHSHEIIWAGLDHYANDYNKRYVVAACTLYKGIKFIGKRHHNTLRAASKYFNEPIRGEHGDGFIDNFMNFLTRKDALILAKETGQFKGHSGTVCDELFSEDLW